MAWSLTDYFPSWGDGGEQPSSGFNYQGGDQVNEKHLDYLWSSLHDLQEEVQAALDDIDSDSDGVVDEADYANDVDASGIAGDGLKASGGDLLIEPEDFAGSGLADDGSDNLELSENSLSVTAGDGLKGGGSVNLGGSTTLNVKPSDFAGSGLADDGNDNLQVNESQIATEEWEFIEEYQDSNTGTSIDKTFDISSESYDEYEIRWETNANSNSTCRLRCRVNSLSDNNYSYSYRKDGSIEDRDRYSEISIAGNIFGGLVTSGTTRFQQSSDQIMISSNNIAHSPFVYTLLGGTYLGPVSSFDSIRLYSDGTNMSGHFYLYGRNNG